MNHVVDAYIIWISLSQKCDKSFFVSIFNYKYFSCYSCLTIFISSEFTIFALNFDELFLMTIETFTAWNLSICLSSRGKPLPTLQEAIRSEFDLSLKTALYIFGGIILIFFYIFFLQEVPKRYNLCSPRWAHVS